MTTTTAALKAYHANTLRRRQWRSTSATSARQRTVTENMAIAADKMYSAATSQSHVFISLTRDEHKETAALESVNPPEKDAMYRCMLSKHNEAPSAEHVDLEVYRGSLASRYSSRPPARRHTPQPHDNPPDAFVLFHRDLRVACMERGVLAGSTPSAMWRAIAANMETYDPNSDFDSEGALQR
jgi:hypothetical protein